jgi:hypothetical protein
MRPFMVAITIMWFGCNNAVRESVKEEPIDLLERAINLATAPYRASQFLILGLVSVGQVLLLLALTLSVLELLHRTRWLRPFGAAAPAAADTEGQIAVHADIPGNTTPPGA